MTPQMTPAGPRATRRWTPTPRGLLGEPHACRQMCGLQMEPWGASLPSIFLWSIEWGSVHDPAYPAHIPLQPPPCNLAISHSNRTFSHPSFQSYYTAVALWNFGAKENGPCKDPTRPATDGNIKQPVLPIDTSDFFFTDPLLPPGHRVYNCLSSRSQQIFKNFRLETPPPIMSVCDGSSLSAAPSAVPVENRSPGVELPKRPDGTISCGSKTQTKWLSMAEHDALCTLLDMSHRDHADDVHLAAPTSHIQEHYICPSSVDRTWHSIDGQSTLRALAADHLGPCDLKPQHMDTLLSTKDLDCPILDLSSAWKGHKKAPQLLHSMDVHVQERNRERQLSQTVPENSSQGRYNKREFLTCQTSEKGVVNEWGWKDGLRVLTPIYQLQFRGHKTDEQVKAAEATAPVGTPERRPEPPAAVCSRFGQWSMLEKDAARALLELQFLVSVENKCPSSHIFPRGPSPVGGGCDGTDRQGWSGAEDVEIMSQGELGSETQPNGKLGDALGWTRCGPKKTLSEGMMITSTEDEHERFNLSPHRGTAMLR
ncbi:histone deacetylase complex subunit SAP25 isoform X2 [Pleurodeles waltl]|uniref:histone deacetylase complex subunit SAP25 isoform X2 n=1 Tax=Pleurodeles waltl TaxID=8319 RepID=UPI003709895F